MFFAKVQHLSGEIPSRRSRTPLPPYALSRCTPKGQLNYFQPLALHSTGQPDSGCTKFPQKRALSGSPQP